MYPRLPYFDLVGNALRVLESMRRAVPRNSDDSGECDQGLGQSRRCPILGISLTGSSSRLLIVPLPV